MSDVQAMVDSQDMIKTHIECSSVSGEGLEKVFQEACRVALATSKPPRNRTKKGCTILWGNAIRNIASYSQYFSERWQLKTSSCLKTWELLINESQ